MCLFTKQICPLRARKDIVCYKEVVHNGHLFITPFQNYVIKDDLPRKIQICSQKEIEAVKLPSTEYPAKYRVFGGMFHAYAKLGRALVSLMTAKPHSVIIKCIIPKGTLYYKSVYGGDICARTLILQEICGNQDNL